MATLELTPFGMAIGLASVEDALKIAEDVRVESEREEMTPEQVAVADGVLFDRDTNPGGGTVSVQDILQELSGLFSTPEPKPYRDDYAGC